ncbi:hypothetical protein DYH09_20645 [bacterium CPR1]|nr:hypothetical protein [bacterium CPR1]
MASGYLDNLISTFGGTPEGPDPNRLEGLLDLVRERLEKPDPELLGHLHRMRDRVQASEQERRGHLDNRPGVLDGPLFALIESNLAACASLEQSLATMHDALEGQGDAVAALEELEGCSSRFLQSCDELAHLAASSTPICPGCGSSGPEPTCPNCQVDRLIPDPEPNEIEFEQVQVNDEFMAVYQAYTRVLAGEAGLAELMQALQPLEFTLLEAQALLEHSLDQHPEDPSFLPMLRVVERALEGVNRMHAVEENRSTRELHHGWAQVLAGASGLRQALPAVAESGSEPDTAVDE